MNIEIGHQEIEFLKFFKEQTEAVKKCYSNTEFLNSKYCKNSKEEKDKIKQSYLNNTKFCELAINWLNRVMS